MTYTKEHGKLAKEQAKAEEAALKEKLINGQVAEIKALRAQISEKNVEVTTRFVKTGEPDKAKQDDIDLLRQELDAMKTVLAHYGALPKKVATTPWKSVGRPFHKDIFKTKKKHKGFELGFIGVDELDNYQANGYNIAQGQDYGEKEGALKRKRLIGVERPIEAADESRAELRAFNLAQRTSALQKTKDMADGISQASGRKTDLKMGYEVRR